MPSRRHLGEPSCPGPEKAPDGNPQGLRAMGVSPSLAFLDFTTCFWMFSWCARVARAWPPLWSPVRGAALLRQPAFCLFVDLVYLSIPFL